MAMGENPQQISSFKETFKSHFNPQFLPYSEAPFGVQQHRQQQQGAIAG